MPTGYDYTWAGEFDSLRKEQKRLAFIIPISLAIIVVLLYMQFGTWKDAFIVIATLPFAAVGARFPCSSVEHHSVSLPRSASPR